MHTIDPAAVGFLQSLHGDIWNLCNNHIMDAGPEGLESTLKKAQEAGVQTIGVGTLIIGIWERFSALVLHLGLSMMVWVAVRKGGKWLWLFPAAIALHAIVDAGAVLLQKSAGMVPLELIVTSEAIAVAAIGYMLSKKL